MASSPASAGGGAGVSGPFDSRVAGRTGSAGDAAARNVLLRWATPLRAAIESLITTLAPEAILLGGGAGPAALSALDRARRTAAIYTPFHHGLHALLMDRLARGLAPVMVTIHSFTPVYFGKPRAVEFGVIHDADETLPRAILTEAEAQTDLRAAWNEPYSAKDDVTHTLRLQATPYGLPNAMLEIRNDLIATPEAQEAMADRLAPVIAAAIARLPQKAPA